MKQLYRKDASGPDRDEIGHMVSCEKCLDGISKMLRLPGLRGRHPFDVLGAQNTVDSIGIGENFRFSTALAFTSWWLHRH